MIPVLHRGHRDSALAHARLLTYWRIVLQRDACPMSEGVACQVRWRLALQRGAGLLSKEQLANSAALEVGSGQECHVRDVDDLNDLKRAYLALVRQYGAEVAEFKTFKQSLLDLNRRHRLEAARMYASIISKVEKKVRRIPVGSRGRPTRS